MNLFGFKRKAVSKMDPNELDKHFSKTPGGKALGWIADAPMFIDGDQVTALYNAVAKPEHETEKITLSLKDTKEFHLEGKASLGGELGLADWLKTVFPFLDAKVKADVEAKSGGKLEKEKGNEIELRPIDTPQRQLVQLALHYLVNLPHRTRIVEFPVSAQTVEKPEKQKESEKVAEPDWLSKEFYTALPRGLVFLDFPAGTKFIPMATELEGGSIHLIYSDLAKSFVGPQAKIPDYPDPTLMLPEDKMKELRAAYWDFFSLNFNATLAMEAIERKVSHGGKPVRWIDYRVPLGKTSPCVHFSISARGLYDTGIFAYRLVKRGYNHGLRVVGTIKSAPAINVLAIFEQ